MFAKATKSRFFAVFAVMMLMLCSVAVIADADAAPYGSISDNTGDSKNQKYTVPISTGQTFTYSNIATNLDSYGTVTYVWSGDAKDESGENGIKWTESTKTLSGKFTTAGTKTGTLTATWTAPSGSNNTTPTQTATQALTFEIVEAIVIDETKTAGYGLVDGTKSGQTVLTIPFSGTTTDTTVTPNYTSGSASDSPFSFAIINKGASGQAVQVSTNKDLTAKGSWTVSFTLSNSTTGQSDSATINLNVYDKIAITNDKLTYYTYEGDKNLTAFTFTISKDDKVEETGATMAFTDNGQVTKDAATYTVMAQDSTDTHKVNINVKDFGKSGNLTGGTQSKDYTATMSVTGKVTSDGSSFSATTDGVFTLKVYRSLEFTTNPKVDGAVAKSFSTGSNNLMTLSANVSGAKYVTINWGDGQISQRSAVTETSTLLNAQHKYANAGMYMITITAENDVGTTSSKVLYAVDSALDVTTDKTTDDKKDTSKGFFEEHGYLFLVFLLILVGLLVAYFYFGIQHPFVLLLAIVCAVLAVALFVYGDFGGIADALKGSK